MWPSPQTLPLLLLGLVPLLYVVVLATHDGLRELTSLRFVGITFLWVGYQLSPWLAYFSGGPWQAFLLVPAYIDTGLLFSTLCMIAFLFGYEWVMRNTKTLRPRSRFHPLLFPAIKPEWIMALTLLSLAIFIVLVGGLHEAWAASHARGAGQFDQRDLLGKIRQMGRVLSMALVYIPLATVSALYLLQGPLRPTRLVVGSAGVLTASLHSFYYFSRASGFAFLIFAFLSVRTRGRRGVAPAVLSLCIAWYLGFVGFNKRGLYNPGVGNFLAAATGSGPGLQTTQGHFFGSARSNPLDSMAPWTRKAEAIETENPDRFQMALNFFWNQNPLPSEILPLKPTGTGLARIMGTWGHTGLPTPALAVLYYVFGYVGFLFLLPLGAAYAHFEVVAARQAGTVSNACVLLCVVSFPMGLHNSMRAMTRPLVYAFALEVLTHIHSFQKQRFIRGTSTPRRFRARPGSFGPQAQPQRRVPSAFSRRARVC